MHMAVTHLHPSALPLLCIGPNTVLFISQDLGVKLFSINTLSTIHVSREYVNKLGSLRHTLAD